MRTKRKLTIFLLIFCLLIPTYHAHAQQSIPAPTKQEIKNGNFNNGTISNSAKYYVEDDQYIYYLDYPSDAYNAIYRINKDGTHKKLITKGSPYYLTFTIDGDYIYAVLNSPSYTLVRMKKDGSQLKSLNLKVKKKGNTTQHYTDETFNHLMINNGWVYFTDKNNNLWRFTTSYTKKKKLKSDVGSFSIINDQIFYLSQGSLYKMKNDGTGNEKISQDEIESYYVNDNWVYYVTEMDGNNGLKKMSVSGSDSQIVFSEENHLVNGFQILGDSIYFTMDTEEEEGGLFKLNKNAESIHSEEDLEKIDSGYCYDLQVLNHSLWYTRKGGNLTRLDLSGLKKTVIASGYKQYIGSDSKTVFYIDSKKMFNAGLIYKASLEGKNKTSLESEKVERAILLDDSIFFTEEDGPLYKIQKDGSEKQFVFGPTMGNFLGYENSIIYEGSYNLNGKYNLTIMNLEGANQKVLASDCSELILVKSDWIYYLSSDHLMRVKLDGTSKETVATNVKNSIFISDSTLYYISKDGSLYYKGLGTKSSAKKIKMYFDSSKKLERKTYATAIIKTDSKSIYFQDSYQNIVKIPIKGGTKQVIIEEVLKAYPTQSNTIYYTGIETKQIINKN